MYSNSKRDSTTTTRFQPNIDFSLNISFIKSLLVVVI